MARRSMRDYRYLLAALPALLLLSVQGRPAHAQAAAAAATKTVSWKAVGSVDIAAFNKDLVRGKPTIDVAVYLPSNFDPGSVRSPWREWWMELKPLRKSTAEPVSR